MALVIVDRGGRFVVSVRNVLRSGVYNRQFAAVQRMWKARQ